MYCTWYGSLNCTVYEIEKIKGVPVDTEFAFLKIIEEKEKNKDGIAYISTPRNPCMLCVLEASIIINRLTKLNINFYFLEFRGKDLREKFLASKINQQYFFHSIEYDETVYYNFSKSNYGKYYDLFQGKRRIKNISFSFLYSS